MYLKTIVSGYLGQDCKISEHNGRNILNFSVATTEKYKDAAGVQHENTTWTNCSWFVDKTTIAQYLKKGTLIIAEGFPSANAYIDKQGQAQAELKLRVSSLKLLSAKSE